VSDIPDSTEPRLPLKEAKAWLCGMKDKQLETLLTTVGDVILLLDRDGRIRDVGGAPGSVRLIEDKVGQRWIDTVTPDSQPKVEELLAHPGLGRWRQINQVSGGEQCPIRYLLFPSGHEGQFVAVGRDDRGSVALQQRLIQVQQSLERDYLALRQAESRYRLLFDVTAEPMVIVDGAARRVREINPAARTMLGVKGDPVGQPLTGHFIEADREAVVAFLGAAATGAAVTPQEARLKNDARISLSARAFRQGGSTFLLLRLGGGVAGVSTPHVADIVERMPDAFVLTDDKLAITLANSAFVELVQAASAEQLNGRPLGEFLGRPGIDLDLIVAQLNEQAIVRNVATIVRGLHEGREEVEVSAVSSPDHGGYHGFSLRVVARRVRDLPPASEGLPRTVEQLTELIGRMPLKDIVRESTDLIERQCIEAALSYTSNNRASAAEILGLSRQSLYSKLHRHGFVNVDAEPE
jgi:transcriptional regulator PpsR